MSSACNTKMIAQYLLNIYRIDKTHQLECLLGVKSSCILAADSMFKNYRLKIVENFHIPGKLPLYESFPHTPLCSNLHFGGLV